MDTADSLTLNGSDLDVSLISPGGSPGVSHEVVLLAVLGSVTNSGDGVVELGSASGGVEDTGLVLLEDGSIGLNSHGDWLLGDGGLELVDGLSWDGSVGLDINLTGVLGSLASSSSSGVGVVILEVLGVLLSVDESV